MPLEVTVSGKWWQLLPVEDRAFGNCRESWEEIGASSPKVVDRWPGKELVCLEGQSWPSPGGLVRSS